MLSSFDKDSIFQFPEAESSAVASKQPKQNDYGDRNANSPKQNGTHGVLPVLI